MMDFVVYSNCEFKYSNKKLVCQLNVTNFDLNINCINLDGVTTKSLTYKLCDIIGCHLNEGQKSGDLAAYLTIYSYPKIKKKCGTTTIRKQNVIHLVYDASNNKKENFHISTLLKKILTSLSYGLKISKPEEIELLSNKEFKQRRLLVLVNPFSGSGKALKIFQKQVAPMMMEADIHYKLIVTEYAGHACKVAKEVDLSEWDGLVIVSGDGLLFEVINGLMERQDKDVAIKKPLGIVPGGSGNALVCSLLYQAGENYKTDLITGATFLVVKGGTRPMDLCQVETSGGTLYSFLSVCWGIVADVDIESEQYRCLGGARFTVGSIKRILGLRKYRGQISYLPANQFSNPAFDGFEHGDPPQVTKFEMPAYTDSVPSNWVTLDGDFVMFAAIYQSHLSQDMFACPSSTLSDSIIYIAILDSHVSRCQLIKAFFALENGEVSTDEHSQVRLIKVSAFRVEPLVQQGILTVDGEVVSYGKLQARILPSMVNMMTASEYNQTCHI